MNRPKVYLIGGFHSGWNEVVKEGLPDWQILDPRETGLNTAEMFTPVDLGMIEHSNAVLAYLECANPGLNGYFELGYAKRAGKKIVIVIEPGFFKAKGIPERYVGMALESSDFVTYSLNDGVEFLHDMEESIVPFDFVGEPVSDPSDVPEVLEDLPVVVGWSIDMAEEGADEMGEILQAAVAEENHAGQATTFRRALDIAVMNADGAGISLPQDAIQAAMDLAVSSDANDDCPGIMRVAVIRRIS